MKIKTTRYFLPTVFLMISCGPCIALAAQSPAASQTPAAPQPRSSPSAIMQPGLDALQQTIGMLRPEKWKTSDAVRQESSSNIDSIHRDLETTLPQLLAAADAAPASPSRMLPAYRNIEALYDVLLRVAEAGNIAASSEQRDALEHARGVLEDCRRTFGDQLASAALAQEQQVRSLQTALRAVPPAPAPVACPPPPPVKKHKARKRAVKKPAPAPASSPNGASASH